MSDLRFWLSGDLYEPWERTALCSNKKIVFPTRRLLFQQEDLGQEEPDPPHRCHYLLGGEQHGAHGRRWQLLPTSDYLYPLPACLTRERPCCLPTSSCYQQAYCQPMQCACHHHCDTPWRSLDKKQKPETPPAEAATLPIETIEASPSTPKKARTTCSTPSRKH
jgi:hypothetical protein